LRRRRVVVGSHGGAEMVTWGEPTADRHHMVSYRLSRVVSDYDIELWNLKRHWAASMMSTGIISFSRAVYYVYDHADHNVV